MKRKPEETGETCEETSAEAPLDATGKPDPLAYLLAVVADKSVEKRLRVRAAVAAAQYTDRKLHDGGKKEERDAAAGRAATGKFSQAEAPKLVVNNR